MNPRRIRPAAPFALSQHDLRGATWQKLEAHLKERLASKRRLNDNPMDEDKRNALVGAIAELKHLLALNPENSAPEDVAG